MFERFNEPARRSLFFARYEASVRGSRTIETEHLLLGILREHEPALVQMLGSANVSATDIQQLIDSRVGPLGPPIETSVEIPFSKDAKDVLRFTGEEADLLLHRHIGPEHLLLGLLRLERGLAWDVLREKGLSLTRVREALVMYGSANSPPPPEIAGMLAGMSPRAFDRARKPSAVTYLMTALDGPSPGRRAADDAGSGGFVSTGSVGFSTLTEGGTQRGIHSIGPISMSAASLSELAMVLEDFLGGSVIDDTGLSGLFEIKLRGQYDHADALIAALRDQLGLVLTRNI